MRRREFLPLLSGLTIWPLVARAQQPDRMRRVGVLVGYSEGDVEGQASVAALRQALRKFGWIEGRNIRLDTRWAGGDADQARTFAKELVGMTPDLIVSSSNLVTEILQRETRTIPIVFVFVGTLLAAGSSQMWHIPAETLLGFRFSRLRYPANGSRCLMKSRLTLAVSHS